MDNSRSGSGCFIIASVAIAGAAVAFLFLFTVFGDNVILFLAALGVIGLVFTVHYYLWGRATDDNGNSPGPDRPDFDQKIG